MFPEAGASGVIFFTNLGIGKEYQ